MGYAREHHGNLRGWMMGEESVEKWKQWQKKPCFHKNDRLIFIFAIFGVFGIASLALIRQAKSKFTSSSESDIEWRRDEWYRVRVVLSWEDHKQDLTNLDHDVCVFWMEMFRLCSLQRIDILYYSIFTERNIHWHIAMFVFCCSCT